MLRLVRAAVTNLAQLSLEVAAGSFTGGALADRYGPRLTLSVGLAGLAIASVLAAYARNAPELSGTRAFMGAGGALITPATPRRLRCMPPIRRPARHRA